MKKEEVEKIIEENSGFAILKEYFERDRQEDESLAEPGEKQTFDLDWVFTETIDRDIIKETLVRLLTEANPKYEEKARFRFKEPTDIQKLVVFDWTPGFKIQIVGADNWTKINIQEENSTYDGRDGIKIIKESEFEKEIQKTITLDKTRKILQEMGMDIDSVLLENAIKSSKAAGADKALEVGVKNGMNQAYSNFIKYNEYLKSERQISQTRDVFIESPEIGEFTGEKRTRKPYTLKNDEEKKIVKKEIMPIEERLEIVSKIERPTMVIHVAEKNKNGDIEQNAYTVYAFENGLMENLQNTQNGILFVSVPLSSDRTTKLFFKSKEEIEKMQQEDPKIDVYSQTVKNYMSVQTQKFDKMPNTRRIIQTDKEGYDRRLRFLIKGERDAEINDHALAYETAARELYGDETIAIPRKRNLKKADLATIGLNAKGEVDRTAQKEIEDKTNDKIVKE